MSTVSETGTAVQASAEVQAIHRQMLRRQQRGRLFTYAVGIAIAVWILLPILFIGSMALTTQETVRTFPKGDIALHPLLL